MVDAGVSTYEPGRLRAYCRSTRAHNTVEIEGRDQAELWAAFRVGRRPRPRGVTWTRLDDGFELSARHDGYRRLAGRPRHARRFRWRGAGELEIDDRVDAGRPVRSVARLHFHPHCRLGDLGAGAGAVEFPGGRAGLSWSGWDAVAEDESFYCPAFGVARRNRCLAFSSVTSDLRGRDPHRAGLTRLPCRPMRILFFSHYYPPESNAPAARTHGHCRHWAAAGHEVTVVTCAPNHPRGVVYPGYRNRLRRVERMDGVRVVRVFTYLAANEGVFRRAASWLSYLAAAALAGLVERRPDVVVATTPQFFCAWAGLAVGRLRRRPVLIEIRDLWPESVADLGALRSRSALGLLDRLARWTWAAADGIVTVGEGYRRGAGGPGRRFPPASAWS